MSYQSPITMYTDQIIKDIVEKQDGYLMEEVRKVGFDINKEELAKALKYDRDQYMRGYTDGRMYKPPVITNADRIRGMSDEELAMWLIRTFDKADSRCSCLPCSGFCNGKSCKDGMIDWLKQENK